MRFAPIATYANAAAGLCAYVTPFHKGGFTVSLEDTDAGEFVGLANIYPTEAAAHTAAIAAADLPLEGR